MSGYILCQTRKAEHPYFVEAVSLNLYSIEELCYYFCTDYPLLDDTILNGKLAEWLRTELGLRNLAQKLSALPDRDFTIGEYIFPVLKEINYLNQQGFRKLEEELKKLEEEPPALRSKRKGDALMGHEKYTKAIETYAEALKKGAGDKTGMQLTGSIYNNMGCAYARLFQMDEACECFRKAYETLHTKEALKSCLFAVYLKDGEAAYAGLADRLRVDPDTRREMDSQIRGIVHADIPENLNRALAEWTREYHRNTGL